MTIDEATEIPSSTPFHLLPTPEANRDLAFARAIDSLSRYKFMMFGYWAALWVVFNNMSHSKHANPFLPLVQLAKLIKRGTK